MGGNDIRIEELKMKATVVVLIFLLALSGLRAVPDKQEGGEKESSAPYSDSSDSDDELLPVAQLPVQAVFGGDAEVLMRLRRAVSNWNETVGAQPGYQGWNKVAGDPCQFAKTKIWTGITCEYGRISGM